MARPTPSDEVRELFRNLHVWKKRGQRAPNKPLLALWAIGRCIHGQSRLAPFQLVDKEVGRLIREFGPPRSNIHVDYPFWRLRNDDVWEIPQADKVGVTGRSGDALKRDLSTLNVLGGFSEGIYNALHEDRALAEEIGRSLACAHFPPTRQEEVLEAAGIVPGQVLAGRAHQYARDPEFRRVVLDAYNFACALCGFAVQIGGTASECSAPIALDAAHIKWHQARGPAKVQNGIALCSLHHKLFDYGAFTLTGGLTVQVAESARGEGSQEWLWRFADQALPSNLTPDTRPDPAFIGWHHRNVFRGSAAR